MHMSAPRRADSGASEVPDLSAYQASSPSANRALSYFMIGSMGVLSASVAKSSVAEFLGTMSASADVLALAKVEVELGSIPEGKNAIIKWRGKPVFIRHRTQDEIDEARHVDWKGLRDPQSDDARVKKPEWLVMLGVCTHLGCVPIGESGDFGGWWVISPLPSSHPFFSFMRNGAPLTVPVLCCRFCPCHGSHYDICMC
jgi:ubiquinol-cytochrome c reductase iron-sulfur subunit